MTIFSPRRENYQFSQPSYIFLIYGNTIYVFSVLPFTKHQYFKQVETDKQILCSSVGSVQDLRTGGRWFDPRLGKDSLRGFVTVLATGFIHDHCLVLRTKSVTKKQINKIMPEI